MGLADVFAPRFISRADEKRLVSAIARAEQGNRGEVRVHIEPRYPKDGPLDRAREVFFELRMDRTRHATGVLLYVAADDRKAAVFADEGIIGAAAPEFWKEAVTLVSAGFAKGDPGAGLVAAVDKIGALLQRHAEGDDSAGNELPDKVSRA